MKVKKDVLVDFLKKATMTGVSALTEGIIDFAKAGIIISSQSASNNVLVNAILKAKAIEDYKPIGQIGINNLQDVSKLLSGFTGDFIKFEIKLNQLIFKSAHRRVKITLMDKDAVQKPTLYPESLDDRMEINISMDLIKGFFKNMNIVNTAEFSFELKGRDLLFNTKGFNEVTEKVSVDSKKGEVKLRLNRSFIDAVENLNDDVLMEMKTDYPISVTSKTEEVLVRILVAPIVDEASLLDGAEAEKTDEAKS